MRDTIIPSYLYVQYADDKYLQAFVKAFNSLAQRFLNTFIQLNLPVYTLASGKLLDWVAAGIYGMIRPSLSEPTELSMLGVYNTVNYNVYPYAYDVKASSGGFYVVTDDYFKRIITWNFYKGDGFQYTTTWLKRRVKRFLDGTDGIAPDIQETYDISVTYSSSNVITITVPESDAAAILNSAIQSGAIAVPFNYSYVVSY